MTHNFQVLLWKDYPEPKFLSRGKRIYFPLARYLQTQRYSSYQGARGFIFLQPYSFKLKGTIPRIRGYDPLDMVSLILIEGRPKVKSQSSSDEVATNGQASHLLTILFSMEMDTCNSCVTSSESSS